MNKKILIIDDEPDMATLLKARLEKNGYETIIAKSGYEGLYKYITEKPALILLDLMLPDLDGYEVCREIRRRLQDEQIPIIMLTAKSQDCDRIKGKVVGAQIYITKPFKSEELIAAVKKALE